MKRGGQSRVVSFDSKTQENPEQFSGLYHVAGFYTSRDDLQVPAIRDLVSDSRYVLVMTGLAFVDWGAVRASMSFLKFSHGTK